MSGDGGSAFPVAEARNASDQLLLYAQPGMTLRDYFAAKAMQSWISASPKLDGEPLNGTVDNAERLSVVAYRYADAMLKERDK